MREPVDSSTAAMPTWRNTVLSITTPWLESVCRATWFTPTCSMRVLVTKLTLAGVSAR